MEDDRFFELDDITLDNIARVLWMREFDPEKIPENILEKILSEKNSPKMFGARMKYRLEDLLKNPDSYTPSYKKRYSTLMKHCKSLHPLQAYAMTHLLGLDSSRGYDKIPDQADLKFPDTHAPQLGYQVGWHFFVGNCKGDNGKEYGILFLLYRYSMLPPPIARHFGLTDMENQVYEFQLAVAEAGSKHYQAKPIAVAGTTGLIEFKNNPFNYSVGKNTAKSLGDDLFPLRLNGWGVNLEHNPVEIEVDLTLESTKNILLQGNNGCLPCCCGIGTLYYSATNLALDGNRSILKLGNETIHLTEGKFWFDHQWGNSLEPLGNPQCELMRAASVMNESHTRGWDWFMAQFDGEREITMAAPHTDTNIEYYNQTGADDPGIMNVKVTGQYIDNEGISKSVTGELTVDKWVKSEKSSDPEDYWITHTWYPNRWTFKFGEDLPEDIRNFTMTPIVEGGQSGFNASGAQYSEGGVYVKTPEGKLVGHGFAESVYYADVIKNMLHLAGLPVTDEMVSLVKKPSASTLLKIKSILKLVIPSNRKKLEEILKKCIEEGLPTSMTE